MAIERLVGSDALLTTCSFGTPVTTGKATEGTLYKIVAKSGNDVFPAGYEVGDFWIGDGVATFSEDNSASVVTASTVAEVSSFSFDISADEIEVTVLADDQKKYRTGKKDVSGSIEGITFVTSLADGTSLANRFFKIVNYDGEGNSTLNPVNTDDLFIKAYLQKDDSEGETLVYMLAQVQLTSYNLGASVADAQSFTANVRLIGNDAVIFTEKVPDSDSEPEPEST